MRRKHLRFILLVLAVSLVLYIPLALWRSEGRTSDGKPGFRVELDGGVPTMVRVIDGPTGDTIRLERTTDGWTMNGYRADSTKVANLLPALDTARAYDHVGRNPANHSRLGVTDADGRRVEIQTDGSRFVFHLGRRGLASGGYFVRRADTDSVFRLQGPVGGYLGRSPDAWRVRTIVRVDSSAVRELVIRRGGEKLVVARGDDGVWRLGDAPADSASLATMLRMLTELSASGFPSDSAARSADFGAPDASLDVFLEDGGDAIGRTLALSLRLLAGPDEGGPWLARSADGGEVVELSKLQVQRLLPLLGTEEDG